MKNTPDSFEYIAEVSKVKFQYIINSLLEFHGHYTGKIGHAAANEKAGVFITIEESELLAEFIIRAAGELMGHYNVLHQCMLHLHTQRKVTEILLQARTPELLEALVNSKTQHS